MDAALTTLVIFAIPTVIIPIAICEHLGHSRNRTGWLWGLFLGWLGVLILACMRPVSRAQLQVAELEAQQRLKELQPPGTPPFWPPPPGWQPDTD